MKQYLWRAVNGHFVPFLPVISWNFIRLEWKFSSAIINYRATRTGNTKMYNNLWYLTDSIQRRNNSSLEKATPNIQATKGGNISYQRNISKIFSFETCRTVNLFIFFPLPPILEESSKESKGGGGEGAWTAKTAARRRFSRFNATLPPSSVFSKLIYAPDRPTRPLCAAGLCRCPFKQIDHRRTGPAHCRSIEQSAGRKGREMAMRLGQMPGEKVAERSFHDSSVSYDGSPRARKSLTMCFRITTR